MKIRLQKFLSQKGLYSRRQVETMISEGEIMINNKLAILGDKVDDSDEIKINNRIISDQNHDIVYIILNKPINYTCTKKRFKNEKNIYELLPEQYKYLNMVGRLDKDSEGLLILTNNGDYIYKTTHPKFNQEKEYLIFTNNIIQEEDLKQLKKGVNIGDEKNPEIVLCKSVKKLTDYSFIITITQGKNRQLRRMCGVIGLRIISLKRIREGNIELGDLKTGEWKEIII